MVCNNCNLINICSHKKITKIHCQYNKLENLNSYPSLRDLKCDNNQLKTIPSMSKLYWLTCSDNPIKNIELQSDLLILDCSTTQIENKISFAPKLNVLYCNDTKVSDLFGLDKIKEIEFCNTNITKLPYFITLKNIIFNNKHLMISPQYKIKNLFEYNDKRIDIIFVP